LGRFLAAVNLSLEMPTRTRAFAHSLGAAIGIFGLTFGHDLCDMISRHDFPDMTMTGSIL
jgi:hypothetical protein